MLYAHGDALKDADFEVLEAASKWKLLMERAYVAPRYDSYFQKHYQLTRAVWNRERNLPTTFIFSGLWSHAIPDLRNLMSFAKFKMHQAREKARAAGGLAASGKPDRRSGCVCPADGGRKRDENRES